MHVKKAFAWIENFHWGFNACMMYPIQSPVLEDEGVHSGQVYQVLTTLPPLPVSSSSSAEVVSTSILPMLTAFQSAVDSQSLHSEVRISHWIFYWFDIIQCNQSGLLPWSRSSGVKVNPVSVTQSSHLSWKSQTEVKLSEFMITCFQSSTMECIRSQWVSYFQDFSEFNF